MCKAPVRRQMLLLWPGRRQHAEFMPGEAVRASGKLGAPLTDKDMMFPPWCTCDCKEGASPHSCSADGCIATPAGALGLTGLLSCHLWRLQRQLTQSSLQAMQCQPGLRQCTQWTRYEHTRQCSSMPYAAAYEAQEAYLDKAMFDPKKSAGKNLCMHFPGHAWMLHAESPRQLPVCERRHSPHLQHTLSCANSLPNTGCADICEPLSLHS